MSGSVSDATGGPIAGARVSLRSATRDLGQVLSRADGSFELGSDAGPVRLSAHADGYSAAFLQISAPARAVRLRLLPASTIVGKVVHSSTGAALAGVRVVASNAMDLPAIGAPTLTAQTAALGEFRLEGAAAGHYQLIVSDERWHSRPRWVDVAVASSSEAVTLLAESSTTLDGEVTVDGQGCRDGVAELSGGGAAFSPLEHQGSLHFTGLVPGGYTLTLSCDGALPEHHRLEIGAEPIRRSWDLSRALTLAGRVEDHEARPIAGVMVNVQPRSELPTASGSRCISDASGEFVCSGLQPGDYECSAGLPQLAAIDPVRVSLDARPAAPLVLRARATGKVVVQLLTSDGKPALGAPAWGVFAQQLAAAASPIEAHGHDGEFSFDHLALGRYRLSVGPSSALDTDQSIVELKVPGEVIRRSLSIPTTTSITGRVVDARGESVPDTWVGARWHGDWSGGEQRPAPTLTSSEGEFRIEGLLPGRYDLSAHGALGEGELSAVEAGGDGARLIVESSAALFGYVVSSQGEAVREFDVFVFDARGQGWQLSGHMGEWQLPRLAPGEYQLRVSANEGSASVHLTLEPGEQRELELALRDSNAPTGREPSPPDALTAGEEHELLDRPSGARTISQRNNQ